ncbi:MAG: hypothetical protein EGS78_02010, partial [Bacteroidales bacterium]|nr:hypothetical protein [Bacteroidales bacterium]
ISFVSIFTFVWILENKSREPLKTRQYATAETLTFLTTNPHRISQLPMNQIIAKTNVAPSRQRLNSGDACRYQYSGQHVTARQEGSADCGFWKH